MKFLALILLAAAPVWILEAAPRSGTAKKSRKRPSAKAPSVSAKARTEALQYVNEQIAGDAAGIENPAALVPFFEQLYRLGKRERQPPISILHYGDSHTAADEWTGELRSLLQAKFGDGGAGFSHAGRPWNSYRRADVRSFSSRNWYTDGLVGREGDGLYGISGIAISTRLPNESVSLQAGGSVLEIYYLRQPGGGELELLDHSERVDTIATDGDAAPGYYRREMAPGPHEYSLRTLRRAPVRLYGWVTGRPEGLTYETMGINGAQASIVLNWHPGMLASYLADRNPALIVLAYGTNEAGNSGLTQQGYGELFAKVIARFREFAPSASILVIGPPDRYTRVRGKWTPYNAVDIIVAAERAAALANGCAFWDWRGKMGGKGSMHSWFLAGLAQYDHVHLNAAGYKVTAGALFRGTMAEYALFLKAREEQ